MGSYILLVDVVSIIITYAFSGFKNQRDCLEWLISIRAVSKV